MALMTPHDWGVFGTFILLIGGLAFLNPKLASIAGLGVLGVMGLRYISSKSGSSSPGSAPSHASI